MHTQSVLYGLVTLFGTTAARSCRVQSQISTSIAAYAQSMSTSSSYAVSVTESSSTHSSVSLISSDTASSETNGPATVDPTSVSVSESMSSPPTSTSIFEASATTSQGASLAITSETSLPSTALEATSAPSDFTTSTAILEVTTSTTIPDTTSTTLPLPPAPTFNLRASLSLNPWASESIVLSFISPSSSSYMGLSFAPSNGWNAHKFTIEANTNRLILSEGNNYIVMGISNSPPTQPSSVLGTSIVATMSFLNCDIPAQGQPLQCRLEATGAPISFLVSRKTPEPQLLATTGFVSVDSYEAIYLYFD